MAYPKNRKNCKTGLPESSQRARMTLHLVNYLLNLGGVHLLMHERRTKKAIMMYKVLNNLAPEYLKDLFRETNQVHDHDLRNSDLNLLPPKPKSNLLKKSFSYSGAVIWNSLPRHVRLANSLTEFKRSLKFSV